MAQVNLITIDPGRITGWSIWNASGVLLAAGTASLDELFKPGRLPAPVAGTLVLIEMPRAYGGRTKGDPDDLLDLAMIVGEIKRHYQAAGCTVELVWPRTWKGTVPKPIHNARVLNALNDQELRLLPRIRNHNMVDAVGLGLWKLRRRL
jgi:hypothetical protein